MKIIKYLFICLNYVRFSPHLFMFIRCSEKYKIQKDIERWSKRFLDDSFSSLDKTQSLIWLLSFKKEYRNVFLYRIRNQYPLSFHLCNMLSPKLNSLYIPTVEIGEGFFCGTWV